MAVGGGGRHSSRVPQQVRWWHRAPEPQLRVAPCHATCRSVRERVPVGCAACAAWCAAHLYTAADAQHREPETMWRIHTHSTTPREASAGPTRRDGHATRVNGPASTSDASWARSSASTLEHACVCEAHAHLRTRACRRTCSGATGAPPTPSPSKTATAVPWARCEPTHAPGTAAQRSRGYRLT